VRTQPPAGVRAQAPLGLRYRDPADPTATRGGYPSRVVKAHRDALQKARRFAQRAPAVTLAMASLNRDVLHRKIAARSRVIRAATSCASSESLATVVEASIERWKDLGERARLNLQHAESKPIACFRKIRALGSITVRGAKWFQQGLEGYCGPPHRPT
jgi:hypothetical protein